MLQDFFKDFWTKFFGAQVVRGGALVVRSRNNRLGLHFDGDPDHKPNPAFLDPDGSRNF